MIVSGQKIESFEGLRGLLALTVCVGHLGLNTATEQFGFRVRFELAVDVFFILSGFVLAHTYYFGKRTFRELGIGRIARLYPLHLLTFLWCAGITIAGGHAIDRNVFIQNVFLVQNVGLFPNRWMFNFPSWSISVEIVTSFLFYFVLAHHVSSLRAWLIVAGLVGAGVASASALDAAENLSGWLNVGLLRGVSGFCLGGAAYLTATTWSAVPRFCGLLTLAVALALLAFFVSPVWSPFIGVGFAACAGLLVLLLSKQRICLLAHPSLVYLGAVSYSVYLLHIPFLLTFELFASTLQLRGLLGKSLVLITVLLTSGACHHCFELPMQRRTRGALNRWLNLQGAAR